MTAQTLLLAAMGLFGLAGLGAMLAAAPRASRIVSGVLGTLASAVGLAAALLALANPAEASHPLVLFVAPPFGMLAVSLDPLSAFMALVICGLGGACCLYSIAYLESYEQRPLQSLGLFTNLFLAAMLAVVSVTNTLWFMVFWEMMTLASYFLVIFESERPEAIRAGYLYVLVAHGGAALILLAFLILFGLTGSFEFSAYRGLPLSTGVSSLVFLLAFVGFAAKAGVVPLHIWLPRAHPAAPSHISALMSGVMIKTAVYGILRVGVDWLGSSEAWWGTVVLAFGALSAVLGVLYALVEKDLKRLLAYSSVENIGIILMGVGVGMIGLARGLPLVAGLGFLAALLHLLNHAFFKGLLFLGAGAIISRTHEQNLDRLGGLGRVMPWTGLAFLTGALAVAALPPLNGFLSEWFTFQALLAAGRSADATSRALGPLAAALLALTGGLAAFCFVKAYGSAFSGPARSQAAEHAREAGPLMRACLLALALVCVALGVGGPWVTPWVAQVAGSLAPGLQLATAGGLVVFPGQGQWATYAPLVVGAALLVLMGVPWLLSVALGGYRAGKRTGVQPWASGYGYAPVMSANASSFHPALLAAFQPLYGLRRLVDRPFAWIAAWARRTNTDLAHSEPLIENSLTRPTLRFFEAAGHRIQALQMGDIRVYCFYIILTLAILLVWTMLR